jgi:hypothetical protein
MDLKKLLREGLLNENGKPFGKNTYKNRFEPTDDIKNKMHLLGVYRKELGINNVNDIKTVDNVNSYYNEFIKKYSEELTKTDIPKKESTDDKDDKDYYNNPDLAKKHVKLYADNFLKIYEFNNNKIQPITTKDYPKFENTFLNKFNFNENIKNRIKAQLNSDVISIENPDGGDVLVNNDKLTILKGSSKSKCIMYGKGQTWCISQSQANRYNTYRIKYKATIYFVRDKIKDKSSDEEKFVIMVYTNGYAIADKSNTGERTGSRTQVKSWDKIVEELPILKGYQDIFKKIDVTEDEIKYNELTSKQYEGDNFQEYINTSIEGLKVNDSEVSDREFVVDYIASSRKISPKQFESLGKRPKGPREGVIEAGYFIRNKYDGYGLSKTEITRVIKLKIKSGKDLTPKEFDLLDDSTRSEAIDNGYFTKLKTSVYNLTNEELIRVLKLKIQNGNHVYPKEFTLLDNSTRSEAIDNGYFTKLEPSDYNLTDEEIRRVVKVAFKSGGFIYPKEFDLLDTPTRSEAIDNGYFTNRDIDDYPLTDEELRRVLKLKVKNIKNESYISIKEFNSLDATTRSEVIDIGYFNENEWYKYKLTDEEISKVIKVRIKSGIYIDRVEFNFLDVPDKIEVIDKGFFNKETIYGYNLTDEEIRRVVKVKIKSGESVSSEEFNLLDTSSRNELIDKGYFNKKDSSKYNLTNEEIVRVVKLKVKRFIKIYRKEFELLDDSTKSEVIDRGYFKHNKYLVFEPVNESINMMKRMNLL